MTGFSWAEDYVYGKDPKKDAEYDISMGMAGIQQAAKDPKLLAQLFQDMQVRRNFCSLLCLNQHCYNFWKLNRIALLLNLL